MRRVLSKSGGVAPYVERRKHAEGWLVKLNDLFHDRDGGLSRVRIGLATHLNEVTSVVAKMREGQQKSAGTD